MPYNNFNNGGYPTNNNAKKPSSNKRSAVGYTTNSLFIDNAQAGKFLQIKFWNKTMGIDIGIYDNNLPLTQEVIQNANRFGHVFGFHTLFDLYEICLSVQQSLKESGTFQPMAILAGQNKNAIIEISNGSNIDQVEGIYLVIYKNLDDGKRSQTYDFFPFGHSDIMKSYNHNTGEFMNGNINYGDFKKLILCLKESSKAFTLAQAHVLQEINHAKQTTMVDGLIAIANSLGIDLNKSTTASNSGYRTNGKSSYNRSGSGNGGNGYQNRGNASGYRSTFQRSSQPGQWGNNGYPNNGNQNTPYPTNDTRRNNAAPAYQEPTNVSIESTQLQQVSMSDFNT